MTTRKNKLADEERALTTLHAVYGHPDDIEADLPINHAAIARMRSAIDHAFDLAWKAARQKAKAEHAAADPRGGFLSMARDAVVARIHAWQERLGPSLQLAHRQLDAMTDDDLCTLLADLEEIAARKGLVS